MPQRLTDNLSSFYLGAANSMRPKKSRHKIIAYVESYDDIAFWRNVLGEFEDQTRYFQIMLPSNTSLSKGKKIVLENNLGSRLGENMIACVDSDYDYLLQDSTSTSRYINKSPYVFQTYVYAIENYQCYAESLHDVCVNATLNDRQLIDFVSFMKLYSQIAYPLFVWSVWFYRKHQLNELSLSDFGRFVKLDHVNVYRLEYSLDAMKHRVQRKIKSLEEKHKDMLQEIEELKNELETLGVTPDNTYLFIQGHHIMNNVVIRLLTPVCTLLRKEREEEISQLATHGLQYQNELSCYEQRQLNLDLVLKKNTDFKDCPIFKKLKADISAFVQKLDGRNVETST
ncbi:PF14491 family protein [Bacteroidetes bacterium oral taxon 272 str. F0290]|mgnify:FL=1|uniref:DUF4435 domain-containing protein n=1 Tax=Phocaeicola abscessus TaxID=555313 RepID=UPI000385A942|nr:DUF4435 domain-containing protein [Phocaeicola abscessus]EPT34004.1 PF14491 family protein [Bacteroidetes bacterium oral taxon 272 str. F0290]